MIFSARAAAFGWAAAVLMAGMAATAIAADAPTPDAAAQAEHAPDQSSQDRIASLVRDLASDSFVVRQHATRLLIDSGIAAVAALEPASHDPDAEVRVRARAILAEITQADFRARLEAFSADYDGSRKFTLPGWEQFAADFGDSHVARQLFVEMQRAEPELLAALAKGVRQANELVNSRCQTISTRVMQNPREGTISLGSVASMLLAGSAQGVSVDEQMGIQLYTWMIYQPVFQQNALGGARSPILKKLLGRWIVRDSGASAAVQNLLFAASFDLRPEGLHLATRALADEHNQANTRQYALLILGRFGSKEHLPIIEKAIADATSCGTLQANNPPRQIELQIRDVALAMALHLTGQNLRDYGYQSAQPNNTTLYQAGTLFFDDATRRDAALKKWAQWRAEHAER